MEQVRAEVPGEALVDHMGAVDLHVKCLKAGDV